ncbi:MAG TPA: hypothetical protein ENJ80_06205 [Gammaproteobacteria bacterium]|nr:hypothetical protein [Gammaproteobacteria bacterium]
MDQGTLSMISAVGGVVAAFGGLFAALAAFRSAGIAKNAADRAQEVERRSLIRDVTASAQAVIAESLRVDDLSNNLKREYKDLSIFSGGVGGSREKVHVDAVEEKQRGVMSLQQEALSTLENGEALRGMSEETLSGLLAKYEGYLIQIRRVKEKLLLELGSVEKQNYLFREKAIKGSP